MHNLEKAYNYFVKGKTSIEKASNLFEIMSAKERIELAEAGTNYLNDMNQYLDLPTKERVFKLVESNEWERAERVLKVLLKENGLSSDKNEADIEEDVDDVAFEEILNKLMKMSQMIDEILDDNRKLREENRELRKKLGLTSIEDILEKCVDIEEMKNGKCVSIDMGKLLQFAMEETKKKNRD